MSIILIRGLAAFKNRENWENLILLKKLKNLKNPIVR